MSIQLLTPDVAAKIAAGEVVERPANVAKELIENSLDAGATEIRVEIREGGQRLLRITDNGCGIPAHEVALAFQRHATSKLHTVDDLNRIATFGFRGEALYSIAAVSQVTLITRAKGDELGVQVRLEGGNVVAQSKAGSPVGTVLSVEHLFFNMPARKKFLRKAATEAGNISSVVQRYALAYPERRFSYINEGRLIFQSTGSGDLFDVLVKIYGLTHAKQMVGVGEYGLRTGGDREQAGREDQGLAAEIDFMSRDDSGDAMSAHSVLRTPHAEILVRGYTSLPSLTRANRANIDLFVNRRYVEDRSLTYAVVQAYHTMLPIGRNPVAALFVEIDPSQVDVNVHPQKTQVRFYEERKVFSAVQKAVRRAVIDHAPVPELGYGNTQAANPGSRIDSETAASSWRDPSGWSARRESILNAGQQRLDLFPPPTVSSPDAQPPQQTYDENGAPTPAQPAESAIQTLSRTPQLSQRTSQLPPLRVVGQVGAMYIITEGPEGMYLIDQHAAHERILYEKFMAQRYGNATAPTGETQGEMRVEGMVAQQQLLQPLTLHVGRETTGLVAQHLEQLNHLGFDVAPFGGDTFLVRAVPNVLSGQDPLRALEEIVASLAVGRNLVREELEARMVKMVCKRAAIKAGQLLSDLEMQELVRQLEMCQSPRTCPHGRPTMIQLSAGELEKAFGRV